MEFNIKKEIFIKTLKIVLTIINKKNNYDNINNFIIDVDKVSNVIFIYCSNIDVIFQENIKADVKVGGSFCVNVQKIFNIIKEINSEIINFNLNNNWLFIRGEFNEIKIPTLDKNNFTKLIIKKIEEATEIKSEIFKKCLKKTIDFASKDPIKQNLNGINLHFINKKIFFYSSNSFVACQYIVDDFLQKKEQCFIIPSKNILEIFSFLENEEIIKLHFNDDFLIIKKENSILQVKLLEKNNNYPNLEKFFEEKESKQKVTICLNSLLKEINILKTVLDEFSEVMKFKISDKVLEIESELMQTGQSKHKLECDFKGNSFKIGLNINQILKILYNMEEFCKNIEFFFQEEKFFLIKGNIKEQYKFVMMPMKINF